MKCLYSVLFIGAALLSGNVYGMEKEVDIRDYADVMEHLTTTANFRADDDFEGLAATALPAIENFVLAHYKTNEKRYVRLCISYLNKVFALRECDAEQVERMFRERYFGDSPTNLAHFYTGHRQEFVGQLKLSKIEQKIKQESFDQLLDSWLPIFDGSNHIFEQFILAQLDNVMLSHRLDISFLRYVKARLENLHCAQEKQNVIEGEIHSLTENLRKGIEARKDDAVRRIVGFLKQNDDTKLSDLLREEFVAGDDTSLFGHGNFVNEQVQKRINFDQKHKKITNGDQLLVRWEDKFNALSLLSQSQQKDFREQMNLEYQALRPEISREDVERKKVLDQQEVQKALEKHRQDLLAEQEIQKQQALEEELRQANERRQQQTADEQREEKRRQFLEQEKAALELKKANAGKEKPEIKEKPAVELPQQPDIGGPEIDNPKGIAALFACISAPKLAIAAVVVGMCYWGYTKYKAHKTAEQAKEQEEKNNQDIQNTQQSVQSKQQTVHHKKQNFRSKKSVR